ncbi:Smr/MutS family protein [bacterium]|nr:Smr/MutS family protein [candidate division CSSED10-310 bacterium]
MKTRFALLLDHIWCIFFPANKRKHSHQTNAEISEIDDYYKSGLGVDDNGNQSDTHESDYSQWHDPFEGAAVAVPIEEFIDLHTYAPDETADVLDAYLEAAWEKGFRQVRIIHGKGRGVQRRIVQSCLNRQPFVERFRDAAQEDGGWGATIAYLKQH